MELIREVLRGYIQAALETSYLAEEKSEAEFLEAKYTQEDLHPKSREEAIVDVVDFVRHLENMGTNFDETSPYHIGYDFFLERSGFSADPFGSRGAYGKKLLRALKSAAAKFEPVEAKEDEKSGKFVIV